MNIKAGKRITGEEFFQPFKSSWFNGILDLFNNRKIPSWLLIILMTFISFLLAGVINALGPKNKSVQFSPIVYLTFIQIAYVLSLIDLLDKRARKALEEFKPVLKSKSASHPLIVKRLTILPAKSVNLITITTVIIFTAFWLIMHRFGDRINPTSDFAQYPSQFTNTPMGIYSFIVFSTLWLINFIFVYHTFYQLNAINHIYTKCSNVDIFQKQEIYAFSKVSATNAIGLILLSPLWIIFEGSSASMVINFVFSAIAIVIFLWPLHGVHNIMKKQKEEFKKETSIEKEKIINSILSQSKNNQIDSMKQSESALSALVKTENEIDKISTWPWKGETIRNLIGAILFPILIWLIQYFLNQLLN